MWTVVVKENWYLIYTELSSAEMGISRQRVRAPPCELTLRCVASLSAAGLEGPYFPKLPIRCLNTGTGGGKVAVGDPVLTQSLWTLTLHIILANLVAWLFGPP